MINELYNKLRNHEYIPELSNSNNIALSKNKSSYYALPMLSNNDTWTFTVNNVQSSNPDYFIKFTIYAIRNNNLTIDSSINYYALSPNSFTRDCIASVQYYIEMRPNTDMDIAMSLFAQDYILEKLLSANSYYATTRIEEEELDLEVKKKIVEQDCDIPLRYDFIEGSLPMGLTFNGVGRIEGVICNIDDMLNAYDKSPSFNWFFSNYEGEERPIGLVFRFKVRVYMVGYGNDDDELNAYRWFCIRVFNNWSYDKGKFLQNIGNITTETLICPPKDTVVLSEESFCFNSKEQETTKLEFKPIKFNNKNDDVIQHDKVELKQTIPKIEFCSACQDPTKPLEVETIVLNETFNSAEEVLRYYIANKNNKFNLTMARLSNSKLFRELIEYINLDEVRNIYSMVEMKLFKNILTLYKFEDQFPLDNTATILINTRNNLNQSLELDCEIFRGYTVEGVYRG